MKEAKKASPSDNRDTTSVTKGDLRDRRFSMRLAKCGLLPRIRRVTLQGRMLFFLINEGNRKTWPAHLLVSRNDFIERRRCLVT